MLEQNRRLQDQLRDQARTARAGFFGAAPPSAKRPLKPNSHPPPPPRPAGGQPGHGGHGRHALATSSTAARQRGAAPDRCPDCQATLVARGYKRRTVWDGTPPRPHKRLSELELKDCPRCRRHVRARAPGVFAKNLFTNQRLSSVAVQHYGHGLPLGSLPRQLGLVGGGLWQALRQLGRRLEPIAVGLVREFRQAPVRHADETGWRTDGHNG